MGPEKKVMNGPESHAGPGAAFGLYVRACLYSYANLFLAFQEAKSV